MRARSVMVLALLAVSAGGGRAGAAVRPLLPDLVPLPPTSVSVGGPADADLSAGEPVYTGCRPDEVAHDSPSPQRCLRFDTRAANTGRGALEMRYRYDTAAGARAAFQRIYSSGGGFTDRAAGSYEVEPEHAHVHYADFAVAYLWRATSRGARVGRAPLRTGHKAGFCLEDMEPYRSAGPARYQYPYACYPTDVTTEGQVAQVNGVSPGWVDVYDGNVAGQYVEVTGVPDGWYLLQIVLDPGHKVREATTANNAVWTLLRLCGDRVELVGRGPKAC